MKSENWWHYIRRILSRVDRALYILLLIVFIVSLIGGLFGWNDVNEKIELKGIMGLAATLAFLIEGLRLIRVDTIKSLKQCFQRIIINCFKFFNILGGTTCVAIYMGYV
ncbi:hypothetical protein ABD91_20370 [Lysinibacillus sphaericus]|uniref:hypothetical protein n=1 Tax=Lysinibacillus sphaericus TaxID=1421 RepID=UPI0018CFD2B8|nr:hypothetical protein [Lysinibacillus sphaericus]MBG9693104.1 hypothetical protein [Lysinibacillus sphaericus]